MAKNGYLNLSDFARLIGVTRRAVTYAVDKGRIKVKVIDDRKMIHGQSGKKQWEDTLDKVASKKGKKSKKKKTNKKKQKAKDFQPKTFEGLTLADADRQDKVYKARLSQLKYLQQAGKLIEVDKVQIQAFEIARKVRDAIMSVPARICHELAVETDPHTLEIKLTKELTDALEKLIRKKDNVSGS